MYGKLVDGTYVKSVLTHSAHWCQGHGAVPDTPFLGAGMLYYALVYMHMFELCVILGSGGGFVPRVVRQAQRDMDLQGSRTILVDADVGPWGRPDWTAPDSFFRLSFPDVIWWKKTADEAADTFQERNWHPGFVHVDANHHRARDDFRRWSELVLPGGIISIHDTLTGGACTAWNAMQEARRSNDWDVIHFPMWAGIAICRRADGNHVDHYRGEKHG